MGQAHSLDIPLGQAHSWDMLILGTGPLLGQFACLLFAGQGLIDNKRPHDNEKVATFFKGMNISDGGGPPMCTARGVFPHGMCAAQGCTSELIPTDPNRSQSDLMRWGIFHRFSVWDKFSRSSSSGDKEHREPEPQDPRPLCADPTDRYCTKDLRHGRDHLGA